MTSTVQGSSPPGDPVAALAPVVPRMLAMASTLMDRAERNCSADDLAAVAGVVNAAASWSLATRRQIAEPAETHPGLVLRGQMMDNGRRRRPA